MCLCLSESVCVPKMFMYKWAQTISCPQSPKGVFCIPRVSLWFLKRLSWVFQGSLKGLSIVSQGTLNSSWFGHIQVGWSQRTSFSLVVKRGIVHDSHCWIIQWIHQKQQDLCHVRLFRYYLIFIHQSPRMWDIFYTLHSLAEIEDYRIGCITLLILIVKPRPKSQTP